MSEPARKPLLHWLEPSERILQVLFGLIMVLTFTESLSVATADGAKIHTMLVGALGCNFAWGIIDGITYLMDHLAEHGRGLRTWRALHRVKDAEAAHRLIAQTMPPVVAATLDAAELESMRQKLLKIPQPTRPKPLQRDEWLGALWAFLWIFATTFPVAIPFIFMHDVLWAMRVSNGIAVVLLFIAGYFFGRCSEYKPWLTGLAMVVLGGALVTMMIALGG